MTRSNPSSSALRSQQRRGQPHFIAQNSNRFKHSSREPFQSIKNRPKPFHSYKPSKQGRIQTSTSNSSFPFDDEPKENRRPPSNDNSESINFETFFDTNKIPFNANSTSPFKEIRRSRANPSLIERGLERCNSINMPFRNEPDEPDNRILLDRAHTMMSKSYDHLLESNEIPWDFSLKSKLVITSHQPFDWCKDISMATQIKGVIPAVVKKEENGDTHVTDEELLEQFCRALHYYRYPCEPFHEFELQRINEYYHKNQPLLFVDRDSGDRRKVEINQNSNSVLTSFYDMLWVRYRDRCHAWIESFRSLYYSFIHKQCDHFYMQIEAFESTILFVWGDSHQFEGKVPTIIMNNTHSRIRQLMTEDGVRFTMPLVPDSESGDVSMKDVQKTVEADGRMSDDDLNVTLEEMAGNGIRVKRSRPKRITRPTRKKVKGDSILIQTEEECHKFFNFWVNYFKRIVTPLKKCKQLPVLYAPMNFLYAVTQTIEITQNIAGVMHERHTSIGIEEEQLYRLELEGVLLHESFEKLLVILLDKQEDFILRCCNESFQDELNQIYYLCQRGDIEHKEQFTECCWKGLKQITFDHSMTPCYTIIMDM